MLRMGPDSGPTILAFPALFEEANRTRAILVATLRRLADTGRSVALPDLPGQGESLIPVSAVDLATWRDAATAAAAQLPGPIYVVAVRAGALVASDVAAARRWYWSPLTGEEQVRQLTRLRALGSDDYAGNDLSDTLLAQLRDADPATTPPPRVVRMESDPRAADVKVVGSAPWSASEPSCDPALVTALANDLLHWIAD